MRRPTGRLPGQGQLHHPLHRVRRQPRLAAPPLGDLADPVDTLVGEPVPPPPHRVRVHPGPTGDLLVRHPVGRPQQRLGLHHLTMRQHRRTASRPNSARWSSVTGNAAATINEFYQTTRLIHRQTTRMNRASYTNRQGQTIWIYRQATHSWSGGRFSGDNRFVPAKTRRWPERAADRFGLSRKGIEQWPSEINSLYGEFDTSLRTLAFVEPITPNCGTGRCNRRSMRDKREGISSVDWFIAVAEVIRRALREYLPDSWPDRRTRRSRRADDDDLGGSCASAKDPRQLSFCLRRTVGDSGAAWNSGRGPKIGCRRRMTGSKTVVLGEQRPGGGGAPAAGSGDFRRGRRARCGRLLGRAAWSRGRHGVPRRVGTR